jgi:hypothetical protein
LSGRVAVGLVTPEVTGVPGVVVPGVPVRPVACAVNVGMGVKVAVGMGVPVAGWVTRTVTMTV